MAQNSIKPLQLTTRLSSTMLVNTFQAINPDGFEQAPCFIRFVNSSNQIVVISYDGINDHEVILEDQSFDFPSQANSQPNAQVALFPKKTVVYARGTAGSGNIFLSGYYV